MTHGIHVYILININFETSYQSNVWEEREGLILDCTDTVTDFADLSLTDRRPPSSDADRY